MLGLDTLPPFQKKYPGPLLRFLLFKHETVSLISNKIGLFTPIVKLLDFVHIVVVLRTFHLTLSSKPLSH